MNPVISISDLECQGTVFLDVKKRTYLLKDPVEVLEAKRSAEVLPTLEKADRLARDGFYVAGYVAYEAGEAFCPGLKPRMAPVGPLVWFGVYREAIGMGRSDLEGDSFHAVSDIKPHIGEGHYRSGHAKVLEFIRAGDIYQCNYTFQLGWLASGNLPGMFAHLRRTHPVGYSAYLNTGERRIASFSPELFLRREGNRILARPMKGTAPRGLSWRDDVEVRKRLRGDPKNQAENIMIVDLMRNDLGRVCKPGSIRVPRLFRVERYGTVHQMTSDVMGSLNEGTGLAEIFKAAFPPGSVTGAPKIRAMQIIWELESFPRGIYCGTVGLIRPGGDFHFNVAIRTVVEEGPFCTMGVGSGLVADSNEIGEWDESILKGRFLSLSDRVPDILETLRYAPADGIASEEEHLSRMRRTARYFGFPWDGDAAKEALHGSVLGADRPYRIRLLMDREGRYRVERHPAAAPTERPVRVLLSNRRMDSADVFLYHKTTRREAYDEEWDRIRKEGYYDAIHLNERGELTEGCITNIVLETGEGLFTPALGSGLLPGVWRAQRIREGVRERPMTLEDLRAAKRVWIGNSVRGEIEVDEVLRDGSVVWPSGNRLR